MNSDLKERLKNSLKQLFQFENEDLDFGIYRILNYKRIEIQRNGFAQLHCGFNDSFTRFA